MRHFFSLVNHGFGRLCVHASAAGVASILFAASALTLVLTSAIAQQPRPPVAHQQGGRVPAATPVPKLPATVAHSVTVQISADLGYALDQLYSRARDAGGKPFTSTDDLLLGLIQQRVSGPLVHQYPTEKLKAAQSAAKAKVDAGRDAEKSVVDAEVKASSVKK
jgi:hypothetical protein